MYKKISTFTVHYLFLLLCSDQNHFTENIRSVIHLSNLIRVFCPKNKFLLSCYYRIFTVANSNELNQTNFFSESIYIRIVLTISFFEFVEQFWFDFFILYMRVVESMRYTHLYSFYKIVSNFSIFLNCTINTTLGISFLWANMYRYCLIFGIRDGHLVNLVNVKHL